MTVKNKDVLCYSSFRHAVNEDQLAINLVRDKPFAS